MTMATERGSEEAQARNRTPADSTAEFQEESGPVPPSPMRSALFFFGVAVIVAGLWIIRSSGLVDFRLPGGLEELHQYVRTYREVVVGGGVLLLGSLIAAFAILDQLPDKLAGKSLTFVRRWKFRRGAPILVVGLGFYAIVLGLVLSKGTSPLIFVLFLVSLALISVAIRRGDSSLPCPRLGFEKIDAVIVPALVVLIISVNLIELTHWRFSFIGDEGAFFILANEISRGDDRSLFDLAGGVYGMHPVLDSAYLSLFLKVFGADIVVWRVAEILVLAASAVLIYALVLVLFGRIPAMVATVILGTNHYLMAFARIGYNNLHAVFYLLLVMLFLVLAWRSERAVFVFLTGIAMGFCIYTFAVALYIWPIVAVLVGIRFLRRPTVREFAAIGLMFAGFFLVVTPGLLTTPPQYFVDLAVDHGHREMAAEDPFNVARISLVRSFLVFWVNPQWFDHYIGGPLLDPITCVLVSIGAALGFLRIRNGAARVGLFWFVFGLLLIAVTNYAINPFFTRLLILVPACALFAAMGVLGLGNALRGLRLSGGSTMVVVLVMTAAITVLNLQQLIVKSPQVSRLNPQIITVKALQENPGQVVIEVGEKRDPNLFHAVSFYPWLRDFYRFSTMEELELPPTSTGPDDRLPIYLVRDRSLLHQLERKLPPSYVGRTDIGPKGYPQIWLLKPSN
jgi:4-amino-4-deoxy-L-arabinose transferase-like glycosyltransferase